MKLSHQIKIFGKFVKLEHLNCPKIPISYFILCSNIESSHLSFSYFCQIYPFLCNLKAYFGMATKRAIFLNEKNICSKKGDKKGYFHKIIGDFLNNPSGHLAYLTYVIRQMRF